MNNLEPRAKIGDVVIVRIDKDENRQGVVKASVEKAHVPIMSIQPIDGYPNITIYLIEYSDFEVDYYRKAVPEEDILKNLTTNISYE